MISLNRLRASDTPSSRFMEEVLIEAFPVEEYRELSELRELTEHSDIFHNNLVLDDGAPVGLITWWDFGWFRYVEHFAIAAAFRNREYGHRTLSLVRAQTRTPLVLEVERPVQEMARRRIGFYQRQGFTLWERDYMQPPYRPGAGFLPMYLMAHGDLDPRRDFSRVQTTIHREVYHVEQAIRRP